MAGANVGWSRVSVPTEPSQLHQCCTRLPQVALALGWPCLLLTCQLPLERRGCIPRVITLSHVDQAEFLEAKSILFQSQYEKRAMISQMLYSVLHRTSWFVEYCPFSGVLISLLASSPIFASHLGNAAIPSPLGHYLSGTYPRGKTIFMSPCGPSSYQLVPAAVLCVKQLMLTALGMQWGGQE